MALPLAYNWRNLWVRKLSTSLTFAVVAIIVLLLAVLLAFAAGIHASLASSGSPLNLIVLKPGATAESTSIMTNEDVNRLVQTPGVVHDAAGQPLISNELCSQASLPRIGVGAGMANVAVRGVDDVAFDVHGEIQVSQGQRFEQGKLEIIVGKAAHDRYADLDIGSEVPLGRTNRTYKVVGIFTANGGAAESEIWGGRTVLSDSYYRILSSSYIRLTDAGAARAAIDYIGGPAVQLQARREVDYYKKLAEKTKEIVALTIVLVGIMSIGAIFAVANTMYAMVDRRLREMAMLRTLGFARGAILLSVVIESLIICLSACLVGLGASLPLNGVKQDFLSDISWTSLAYELRITPGIAVASVILATLVGVFGALAPAMRASRVRVIEALRKA